jgi:hypothetical protein
MRIPGAGRRAATTVEFALIYGLVLLPLSFMFVFACQMVWVWHSVAEWTRAGAKYAATHCYQAGGDNVRNWMRENVPRMVEQDRFRQGEVEISVEYFAQDAASGAPVEFTCEGSECSPECIPDQVRVTVSGYEFRRMLDVLGLPPVALPDFRTSVSMEGAGCNAEESTCAP